MGNVLSPRSVAVIGASTDPAKVGNAVLTNLLRGGFTGPVYPVNAEHRSVHGVRAYPTVRDIPDDVDLAVVAVPAESINSVLDDCLDKGVKALVVVSSGFGESGPDGRVVRTQTGPCSTRSRNAPHRSECAGRREQRPRDLVECDSRAGLAGGRQRRFLLSVRRARYRHSRRSRAQPNRVVRLRFCRQPCGRLGQRPSAVLGFRPVHRGGPALPGELRQPAQVLPDRPPSCAEASRSSRSRAVGTRFRRFSPPPESRSTIRSSAPSSNRRASSRSAPFHNCSTVPCSSDTSRCRRVRGLLSSATRPRSVSLPRTPPAVKVCRSATRSTLVPQASPETVRRCRARRVGVVRRRCGDRRLRSSGCRSGRAVRESTAKTPSPARTSRFSRRSSQPRVCRTSWRSATRSETRPAVRCRPTRGRSAPHWRWRGPGVTRSGAASRRRRWFAPRESTPNEPRSWWPPGLKTRLAVGFRTSKQQLFSRATGLQSSNSVRSLSEDEAVEAADAVGYPVAVKATGEMWRHRPDLGGVRLDLVDRNRCASLTEILRPRRVNRCCTCRRWQPRASGVWLVSRTTRRSVR